jgi:aspartyl-tRNA(Asn)/glutamyl-tRNA(Gln) amidotransferase subunit C
MQIEDIKKLASMARLDISESEMTEIAHDFEPILAYVAQVQEISASTEGDTSYVLENVMREDISTNKTGEFTEKVEELMPEKQDGFLKVKQIL